MGLQVHRALSLFAIIDILIQYSGIFLDSLNQEEEEGKKEKCMTRNDII